MRRDRDLKRAASQQSGFSAQQELVIGILPTSAVAVIPKRLSEHHMKLQSFPSEMSEALKKPLSHGVTYTLCSHMKEKIKYMTQIRAPWAKSAPLLTLKKHKESINYRNPLINIVISFYLLI